MVQQKQKHLCLSLFREQVKHLHLFKCLPIERYILLAVSNMDDFVFYHQDYKANQYDCQLGFPQTSQHHTRRALVIFDICVANTLPL